MAPAAALPLLPARPVCVFDMRQRVAGCRLCWMELIPGFGARRRRRIRFAGLGGGQLHSMRKSCSHQSAGLLFRRSLGIKATVCLNALDDLGVSHVLIPLASIADNRADR
jgi:hypothetical protein